jgi:hypothetical protein
MQRSNKIGDHVVLMSAKKKLREIAQKDSAMAQMITWLDGYAELQIVDPLRIQRLLKSSSGSDLDRIWKGVEDDVSKIVDLPAGSEKVKRYSNMASYARLASLILGAASFAFLIFVYFYKSYFETLYNELLVPAVVIGVLYAAIMVTLFASRRMNSAVRECYQEHAHELSKSRTKLRESAQLLIDRLQQDVVSHDLDPMHYRFHVFHREYRNINVDGRGPRFSATVRGRVSRKTS